MTARRKEKLHWRNKYITAKNTTATRRYFGINPYGNLFVVIVIISEQQGVNKKVTETLYKSMIELSKSITVNRVSNFAAAAETAITSNIVNMAGYGGVTFIAELDTVVDTCVLTLTAYENSINSTGGATAVTGASCTFTASNSSNNLLLLDVLRPTKQYVYCVLTRTTANATVDSILALQYRATNLPVTQPASVIASAMSTPEV